ncbi:MAG: hypothetical protein QOI20_3247 [Acidimicrobiaceae bacterium]|jgi:KaiC/GvpD/RAD55 family RecA-like ATPase|nr:hypothetical protein [Acidimicrobiaceae bacterium]
MTASSADIARLLALLARPGDVFELRGLARINGQQHVTSGYFDDVDELVRAAAGRSGKDNGVYITINPTKPALLARAPKNTTRRAGSGDTTSDRDVERRGRLLIDVDPVRPAGISSSEDEHAAALALAKTIRDELTALGWPAPVLADSSNGGHLLYAIDLPVDDGGLVKRVLEEMHRRFATKDLEIDKKVYNPARISKVYGTLTRKGESTTDRPHRLSRILEAPEALAIVTRDQLEAFAPAVGSGPAPDRNDRTRGTRDYTPRDGRPEFDLVDWIAEHLPDAVEREWSEGRKWLIPTCPLSPEHDRKEAFIVQKHDGTIAAGCQHNSCFSSWRELRLHFEPDAYDRSGAGRDAQGRRLTDREPPPETLYEDERYQTEISAAELDTFADRDREEPSERTAATISNGFRAEWHDSVRGLANGRSKAGADGTGKPPWLRGPELAPDLKGHYNDPWVSLRLVEDELCRVAGGAIVVVMGGSGSGKSSLVSNVLLQHARDVGPAIALSIELPAHELAARIVGIRCDASWEDALRGRVRQEFVEDALNLPRLYVIDRERATIENLARCVEQARKDFPGEAILVAIDYAQLLESSEREIRMRVTDAFKQIDRVARRLLFVAIAVSQMSRASAVAASSGEKIGAESAALGAESAAIEQYSTVTLSIGKRGEPRQDGSRAVELSVGKGRMSDMSDRVIPMSYWGRSGLWRVSGDAISAAEVRAEREIGKANEREREIGNLLVGIAHRANTPLSRDELSKLIGKGNRKQRLAIIESLVVTGELVEVNRTKRGSRSWLIWTPDRANTTPGIQLASDMPSEGAWDG